MVPTLPEAGDRLFSPEAGSFEGGKWKVSRTMVNWDVPWCVSASYYDFLALVAVNPGRRWNRSRLCNAIQEPLKIDKIVVSVWSEQVPRRKAFFAYSSFNISVILHLSASHCHVGVEETVVANCVVVLPPAVSSPRCQKLPTSNYANSILAPLFETATRFNAIEQQWKMDEHHCKVG